MSRDPSFPRDLWSAASACIARKPVAALGAALTDVSCASCSGRSAHQLFDRAVPGSRGYSVVRCDQCGLAFLYPMPDDADIPSFYEMDYYGHNNAKFGPLTEQFVFLFRLARLRALRMMSVRSGRVLDVGCARGLFLKVLHDRGFDVYGTELNASSAETARELLGDDRIHAGSIETAPFTPEYFDAITGWQVFEHLPDPAHHLTSFHRWLRPGGVLLLSVPNISSWQARWAGASWFHLDLPRHLFHYDPATLTALVERHGFRVEAISHYSLEQNPFGLMQSALHRLGARHLGLYEMLRGPLDHAHRSRLRRLPGYAAYLGAFPVASLVSYLWSFLGSGATFTLCARRSG